MKNDIIKVGDSLYMKVDSIDQLSAIVKFLDDAKLKKAMEELRESMKKDAEPKYNWDDWKNGLPSQPLAKQNIHFNSITPKEVEENLFDHEASLCDHEDRLSRLEEDIPKLEKAVMDIPKTLGKVTEKMLEANMGDKDKDLKSFSMNLYWNYDDSEDEEDDD